MLPAAFALLFGLQLAAPQIHHASGAADLARFPDAEIAAEQTAFARAHVEHLENSRPLWSYRLSEWWDHKREAESLYERWRLLHWAHQATAGSSRRYYMDQLREAIGDDAFAAGEMPPPVPFWRFVQR